MKNLIGKRVQRNDTLQIGIIEDINENIMSVSFHGKISKYSYPAAFTSTLTIEDEDLQQELSAKGIHSEFDLFRKRYYFAIMQEIEFLKSDGGKKNIAIDGERIKGRKDQYLYIFDTDTELNYPEGADIKLWLPQGVLYAYVVACEDFTITIRTLEEITGSLAMIEFTANPWYLLEALAERLYELDLYENSIAYDVACKGSSQINEIRKIRTGQSSAINRAMNERVTFIWGPPGTGKTETLADIAIQAMELGQRVLMLSYSNVSVDGALLRVSKKSDFEPGQVIRYGYPRDNELAEKSELTSFGYILSQYPELDKKYRELREEKRKTGKRDDRRRKINEEISEIRNKLIDLEKSLIHRSMFVATTVSKAVVDAAIYNQQFDVVIFDEASMAYVPQVVYASGLAKKHFVCLGDFRQLPAIVQNPEDKFLKEDIFEYVKITQAVEEGYSHNWLVMLNEQYRMHSDIADFVSGHMYGGLLQTSTKIAESRKEIASVRPLGGEAISLVDLSGSYSVCIKTFDGSHVNLMSAMVSIKLAEEYIDKYEVGITTPYSAQSRLIISMLRDLQAADPRYKRISCATVHQFQGSEKAVIIYDAVDCYRIPYIGTLLTKKENDTANRLFNVALTRAKGKFILVANAEYMYRKKLPKRLLFFDFLKRIAKQDIYLDMGEFIDAFADSEVHNNEIYCNDKDYSFDNFIEDIAKAKKSVFIDIPGIIDDDNELVSRLSTILEEKKKEEVSITIRNDESINIPRALRSFDNVSGYVTTPVTVIDDRVVWFGQPLSLAEFNSEEVQLDTDFFPCFRVKGRYSVRTIKALFEIHA